MGKRLGAGEGGEWTGGWTAVLALWVHGIAFTGLTKSLGLMLPTLQEQFQTKAWVLGAMTSQITVMTGISAPFVKPVTRYIKPGYTFMICAAGMAAACVLASLAANPAHLVLLLAIPVGISNSVLIITIKDLVARVFSKNYATAVSLGYTGNSFGLFLLPPLAQLFLTTYGWRGTMLLLGAIISHLTACGALMVTADLTNTSGYQRVAQVPAALPPEESGGCSRKLFFKDMNFAMLVSGRYWALVVLRCVTSTTYDLWIIYFVSMAESIGFSLQDAAVMVAVGGVANLLAKLVQALLLDRRLAPHWLVLAVAIVATSVAFCSSPWLTSYWPQMAASVAITAGTAFNFCLADVISRDVIGVENFAAFFGWSALTKALLSVALGFFPGWVYDVTGGFDVAFLVIGGLQSSTLVPLLLLRYFQCID